MIIFNIGDLVECNMYNTFGMIIKVTETGRHPYCIKWVHYNKPIFYNHFNINHYIETKFWKHYPIKKI